MYIYIWENVILYSFLRDWWTEIDSCHHNLLFSKNDPGKNRGFVPTTLGQLKRRARLSRRESGQPAILMVIYILYWPYCLFEHETLTWLVDSDLIYIILWCLFGNLKKYEYIYIYILKIVVNTCKFFQQRGLSLNGSGFLIVWGWIDH